jgi:glycosyltransferase involved in cell wall biosynthesis
MTSTAEGSFHIAVNAHLLSGQAGYRSAGVHQYIHALLSHLGQVDDKLRYTVLLGEGKLGSTSLTLLRSRWPTSKVPVRVVWEQCALPWVLRYIKADLVHGPVNIIPLLSPCPTITTIHDLCFVRFRYLLRPSRRLYQLVMTRLSARRARRIIAVSTHTADEITRLFQTPRERIDVIQHGVDPSFHPRPAEEVETFRQRHGLPDRFVLAVGTLEPRKNHTKLVEAFSRIYDSGVKLILVGGRGWLYKDLFARVETLGLSEHVTFAGYVPNEELPLWYNAATIFVYPSLYEGFGMPILEAQACGTPVLTSNIPPMTEAAGDAALLVPPTDVDALAMALQRLLTETLLQQELKERGLAHAKHFSWRHTAQKTTCVYRRALAGDLHRASPTGEK